MHVVKCKIIILQVGVDEIHVQRSNQDETDTRVILYLKYAAMRHDDHEGLCEEIFENDDDDDDD